MLDTAIKDTSDYSNQSGSNCTAVVYSPVDTVVYSSSPFSGQSCSLVIVHVLNHYRYAFLYVVGNVNVLFI